jgi:hypothetical protein
MTRTSPPARVRLSDDPVEHIRLTVTSAHPHRAYCRVGEPVTWGLPFPRGVLDSAHDLILADADGRSRPVQTRVLDRWSDGSVRWVLLDAQLDWSGLPTHYWLAAPLAPRRDPGPPARRLSVVEQAGAVAIDTGVARFTCRAAGTFPFERVTDANGADLIDVSLSGLRVRNADGDSYALALDGIDIEENGPVRVSLRWRGRLTRGSARGRLVLDARADFSAGSPVVRMRLTIRNPQPARHPGNFWELGDSGSVLLRETALDLSLAGSGPVSVECSAELESPLTCWTGPFELYQESSGGDHWDSPTHVNRDGRVPMEMRGYRLHAGEARETGLRATPVVNMARGQSVLTVAAPHFWQNFPGSIEVREATLALGLWPRQFPDVHELQGGEQKTHELALAFGRDPVSAVPLDWCRAPALVHAEPSWYCDSGVVPHLVPEEADHSTGYRSLVRAAVDGVDTFAAKRERIDEFGWRHFGDIYADHEAVLRPGDPPLVSHYNNQYDSIAGCAVQFFRSGDVRWWTLMVESAAHVVDIDLYHTTDDKAAYSGGAFWHTSHYVDAGRSTHRSYPRAPGVSGGGPSCEHLYTAGLLLHHFLTGSRQSRAAVIQLADWVLQVDDGNRTRFRWLDRGDTGLASATRDLAYHGPGRGAAYSIAALLDGYRLTGLEAYRDKADQLVRRCIHPRDDVAGRRLLDAEERWSYTVFLQVLARYLDESAERGARGVMYAWARESLLLYARWMAAAERPYLDAPERLEYPTETWAATDMRKCEVLLLASLHAGDAAERQRLRDRAAFFFTSSTETLQGMPTRTLARPVVILLTNGFRMGWFTAHADATLPDPEAGTSPDPGTPRAFRPQRLRACRRATWIAGTMAAIGAVMLLRRWLG